MFKINSGANSEIEINKKIIISYHLNLLINQAWVAEVKTNIPIKEVTITSSPCQTFSIPINNNSWLNKNTIGKIPVLKLYQKACRPVLSGSPPEMAAAAYDARPTGGVHQPLNQNKKQTSAPQ